MCTRKYMACIYEKSILNSKSESFSKFRAIDSKTHISKYFKLGTTVVNKIILNRCKFKTVFLKKIYLINYFLVVKNYRNTYFVIWFF